MTRKWINAALHRAVRTFAQTAIGCIGAATVFSAVDWPTVISAAGLAALLSLLMSVAGLPEVRDAD